MKPCQVAVFNILLVSTLLIVAEPTWAQDKEPAVRRDRYDDPLPPGAIARLGTTRLRHGGGWRLREAAFSADGKMLASFGGDHRLRVWDTANGKELRNTLLKSFSDDSLAVAFSGDGKTVAVSSYRTIALCDVGGAEARRFLSGTCAVRRYRKNDMRRTAEVLRYATYHHGKKAATLSSRIAVRTEAK